MSCAKIAGRQAFGASAGCRRVVGCAAMNERMAPATEYFAATTIPGHILGVIFGLVIFGLGVAKGTSPAISARKVEVV